MGDTAVRYSIRIRFNEGVAEDEKMAALYGFTRLQGKIDGIAAIEAEVAPSERIDGFTHAVTMTMRDRAAVDAFETHAAYNKVLADLDLLVAGYRPFKVGSELL